jgi:hypothetical protein
VTEEETNTRNTRPDGDEEQRGGKEDDSLWRGISTIPERGCLLIARLSKAPSAETKRRVIKE